PKGRKGVKIGLFQDPSTGKYFRAKVPDDYPVCG
ncbi:MAG: chorismate-binding protein, partial [Crenarchaeota archaeon]|nr:chorismate-binding protein [Thermoproteota archaeon]